MDGVGGAGIGEGAPEIVTGSRDGKRNVMFTSCNFITRTELKGGEKRRESIKKSKFHLVQMFQVQ